MGQQKNNQEQGVLYVVATPIGNLEDVTLRALRVLREADLVVCEDTRTTKKLLAHHSIAQKTESYHARSTDVKLNRILGEIGNGKTVAVVSDAGTPAISDPGARLVARARETLEDRITVVAVPGPSAVTAALSVSGLPSSEFLFLGFLPHKKGREKCFAEIAGSERTVTFYESPHRIRKALASLVEHLPKHRTVVVARELTKVHEEVVSGSAETVLHHFEHHPETIRGEFVVMIAGKKRKDVL